MAIFLESRENRVRVKVCSHGIASTITVICFSSVRARTFYEGHFWDVVDQISLDEFQTVISGYNEDLYGRLWYYFTPGYILEERDDTANRLSSVTKEFTYYRGNFPGSTREQCCLGRVRNI